MYEEILQRIEKECEIRNLSPRTCFIYKFHTTKFLEWAGEKSISELTLWMLPTDITEFDESLGKKLIEKITVFEDHFTIDFKSGVTIDIEA